MQAGSIIVRMGAVLGLCLERCPRVELPPLSPEFEVATFGMG